MKTSILNFIRSSPVRPFPVTRRAKKATYWQSGMVYARLGNRITRSSRIGFPKGPRPGGVRITRRYCWVASFCDFGGISDVGTSIWPGE